MQPKQQTVKVRVEIGPGLPRDVGAFHQPHAFQAILAAFYRALTAERVYPEAVFTGTSNGVSAHLTPIHFDIGAQTTLPTTHHIECVGTVELEGEEGSEIKPISGQEFLFPMERAELDAMKKGHRRQAMVPVSPDLSDRLKPGARVTFFEASADPVGTPIPVPGGVRLSLTLTEVKDQDYQWAGRRLYSIAWDPDEAERTGPMEALRSR
jgi:hypothetical protein